MDPTTGELLWKASNESDADLVLPEMTSGIVGNIALIDNSSSGYVVYSTWPTLAAASGVSTSKRRDHLKSYATGGVIFDSRQRRQQKRKRPLLYQPDVVYTDSFDYMLKDATTGQVSAVKHKPRYMLNIGSGYRCSPAG